MKNFGLFISFFRYFNKKYKRVGHLFQDRFKSEVVEEDNYVLSLARYIHQNPVKAGIVKKAAAYGWSSYNCYLNNIGVNLTHEYKNTRGRQTA
ncbi:hypothetical protein [Alkaliphilus serpentinus]|uniref:hypothetical protein n=1 Tax=Alkaliphilus serpentinus TaxID=1482731 RepID=UPI001A9B0461|nr:hypothetical protein [Alkaliphilus serpentinus]